MLPVIRFTQRVPVTTQCFKRAFTVSLMAQTPQKKDPDQRMFDRNKKKLEHLEEEGHEELHGEFKRPSVKTLKKKGKEAPIKQQRPDDGVY